MHRSLDVKRRLLVESIAMKTPTALANKSPFSTIIPLRFRLGDPAGISFFANVYPLSHDAFEDFVQYLGFEWKLWFENKDWGVPLRHTSCEYRRPMVPGNDCEITVLVEKIGETSLAMKYVFRSLSTVCAEVLMVHTFMDIKSMSKRPIPSEIRDRFETYQRECLAP